MAELTTLARPYAKAAFQYALDHNDLARWQQQLETVSSVAVNETMASVLTNPSLTAAQQADMLCDVFGDALTAELRNFIAILASNKRLGLLPKIYAQFSEYKANLEKTVDVEVISAFDLADSARDRLAEVLGKKLERQVEVRTATDSNLLGGVVIRAGDMVIDGSVRGKLDKLAEALNS